jgi:hypothetical protein
MNNTRERALIWTLAGIAALGAAACVPDDDAMIGKTDQTNNALTSADCEAQGGVPTPDPGDGSLLANGCPQGETLGTIDDEHWIEGGLCCEFEQDTLRFTVDECEAALGTAVADPGDGSLLASGECPHGGSAIGTIDGFIEGGLCCVGGDQPNPDPNPHPSFTPEACEAEGGEPIADPGDGSLRSCPDGRPTLGSIEGYDEGGLCCGISEQPPTQTFSVEECEAEGAIPTPDPGDGSLTECPEPQITLGSISEPGWDEGGLCCKEP